MSSRLILNLSLVVLCCFNPFQSFMFYYKALVWGVSRGPCALTWHFGLGKVQIGKSRQMGRLENGSGAIGKCPKRYGPKRLRSQGEPVLMRG
jgi:hypothetical protein